MLRRKGSDGLTDRERRRMAKRYAETIGKRPPHDRHDHLDDGTCLDGYLVPPPIRDDPLYKRDSIRATYDSRETGPQYHVTTRVGDHTVSFQRPVDDPFVNQTVTIGWSDLLRALILHRELQVSVIVDGVPDRVNDVLELDDNSLIAGSTRRAAFNAHINERLRGSFDPPPPVPSDGAFITDFDG